MKNLDWFGMATEEQIVLYIRKHKMTNNISDTSERQTFQLISEKNLTSLLYKTAPL